MPEKSLTVLFAAGGTGGHLYPAIAIAEEIRKIRPEARIVFVGTKGKIEAQIVPQRGFEFRTIWISGFHRRLTIVNLLFPLKVAVSLAQSFFLIRKLSPSVAIGTGGYVSGPVLAVASRLGIPTVVHESNSYPGVTTRLISSKVDKVFITFEVTKRWLRKTDPHKIELVGNPTRDSLGSISREEGIRHFKLNPAKKTLLVFGGSLGASSLNTLMKKILAELSEKGIQVIWQTGAQEDKSRGGERDGVWTGKFIEAMEYAYAAADVILCRAGATTLAELTRLGKPAILVPYPHAAAQHQDLNARAMVEAGAAVVIKDTELESRALEAILKLLSDEALRRAMAERSRELGAPQAGKVIASKIVEMVNR